MTTKTKVSLDAVDAAAEGSPFRPPQYGRDRMTLQVSGIVAGDVVQVMASNDHDPDAGTGTWSQLGDDITANDIYSVELGAVWYRADLSDDSGGGAVTAVFGGYGN